MSETPRPNGTITRRDLEYLERLMTEHWLAHARQHDAEQRSVDQARETMEQRLNAMNEFRASLTDVVNRTISRELFDQRTESVDARLGAIERNLIGREVFKRENEATDTRLATLEQWRARAGGAAIVLTLVAGAIGAAVMKVLGG